MEKFTICEIISSYNSIYIYKFLTYILIFFSFFVYIYYLFQTVISNVLNNAKEILKMLVTMTGYMTNTISMCQELVASNTAVRLSSASAGSKE